MDTNINDKHTQEVAQESPALDEKPSQFLGVHFMCSLPEEPLLPVEFQEVRSAALNHFTSEELSTIKPSSLKAVFGWVCRTQTRGFRWWEDDEVNCRLTTSNLLSGKRTKAEDDGYVSLLGSYAINLEVIETQKTNSVVQLAVVSLDAGGELSFEFTPQADEVEYPRAIEKAQEMGDYFLKRTRDLQNTYTREAIRSFLTKLLAKAGAFSFVSSQSSWFIPNPDFGLYDTYSEDNIIPAIREVCSVLKSVNPNYGFHFLPIFPQPGDTALSTNIQLQSDAVTHLRTSILEEKNKFFGILQSSNNRSASRLGYQQDRLDALREKCALFKRLFDAEVEDMVKFLDLSQELIQKRLHERKGINHEIFTQDEEDLF